MGKSCRGVERLSLFSLIRAHRLVSARIERVARTSDGEDPQLDILADKAICLAEMICRRARTIEDIRLVAGHFAKRGAPHNDFEGSHLAMVLVRSMAGMEA